MNLVLDTETGRFEDRNNPYSKNGELVSVHSYTPREHSSIGVSHSSGTDPPEGLQNQIKKATRLIGFNFKFDLAFLRKWSFLPEQLPDIWDVQLAHFLLSRQQSRMPSLNQVLEHYGLPLKHDVVKTEYWDKGIETRDVPWPILCEYGEYDCYGTYQAFLRQQAQFQEKPQLYRLFRLQCQDLVVLHEMEWNGLKYNSDKCKISSEEILVKINQIKLNLERFIG